jgi:hypothetical protein
MTRQAGFLHHAQRLVHLTGGYVGRLLVELIEAKTRR